VALYLLILIPIIGIFFISNINMYDKNVVYAKYITLLTSVLNAIITFAIFLFFNFSNNTFQFVQEHYDIQYFDIYLGIDGISIYFILLTSIIMPIAIVSN
jgi:NADH-ubiquinone oxidoreductase chain 4